MLSTRFFTELLSAQVFYRIVINSSFFNRIFINSSFLTELLSTQVRHNSVQAKSSCSRQGSRCKMFCKMQSDPFLQILFQSYPFLQILFQSNLFLQILFQSFYKYCFNLSTNIISSSRTIVSFLGFLVVVYEEINLKLSNIVST